MDLSTSYDVEVKSGDRWGSVFGGSVLGVDRDTAARMRDKYMAEGVDVRTVEVTRRVIHL